MASRNLSTFLLLLIVTYVSCAPLVQNNQTEEHVSSTHEPATGKPIDFDLPYGKYLREVMDYLEEDPSFKKYLEKATEEDIASGKLANQLQFVSHHVRSKLDEVKRKELDRLKKYARRLDEINNGIDVKDIHKPGHLDVVNPHSFEIADLTKLIKRTTNDLEEANRQRRKEFKDYEMEKEWERQEKLRQMDEEHRKQAEREYEEQMKKRKDHPKVHHPGSKAQLEDVWEKEDHLPAAEFNSDTLFNLHDLNEDGHWSEDELMAMFIKEVEKEGGDTREREEEMYRMKEHVMNETDTNRDGLISKKEFDVMVARQDFNQDQGWDGIEDQQPFDNREFEAYQREYHPGYYPPPPVYIPQGEHGAPYPYVPQPNGYPMGQQPPYPQGQGNQIGQVPYPGGQGHTQGNYQFQQPQFQQGNHPAQFQQNGQQQSQFQQGNQQLPQFQQGGQQHPQFQQQPPQFQQGGQQPSQFQQQQPPQFQQQQHQSNQVPNQINVQGQQQINQGTFSSSTEKSAASSTNKAEGSLNKASESQVH